MTGSVRGAVSNLKYERGKRPSVFKQPWPTERVQLLRAQRLGSLSQRARGLKPYTPSHHLHYPLPHYDQHQMLTIPGQRSQSMLGRTKADLQPIGSTLLTACNLLMSLVRPHRAGVRANRRVCPPSPALMRSSLFPLKSLCSVIFSIVASAAAPVCPQGHMDKVSHWQLLISH